MEKPTKGPLSKLTQSEFEGFVWTLGQIVFGTVPASAFARHKTPFDTVRDYVDLKDGHPLTQLAKQYWKDLCSRGLNTEQLCEKCSARTPRAWRLMWPKVWMRIPR